jgi:bifunctional oligoribonuclease and PAP phosphatase NrnA
MTEQNQTERQKIVQAIKEGQQILLVIGQRPSGDQIGSAVALAEGLGKLDKTISITCPDPLPQNYSFLEGLDRISEKLVGSKDFILEVNQENAKTDHLGYKLEDGKLKITITPKQGNFSPDDVSFSFGDYQFDLIISLGVSELSQLGDIYQIDPEIFYKTKLANIDCQSHNQLYGQLNWIDHQASSVCEMMVSLLESAEIQVTEPMATALLAGLMSATDRFQSSKTTAKALTVAAQLTGAGADRSLIINRLFKTAPYLYLKSWGRIMENLTIDPTLNLAWSVLTKEDISQLSISPESIREGLDRLLTMVQEAELVALIREEEKGAKVSLRSRGQVDVAELAKKFGGGGQPQSAGFQLKSDNFSELREKVIRLLKGYQKENS